MAEDDELETLDNEDEGGSSNGKLKLIIFITLGVILVALLSILGTWFMLRDKLSDPSDTAVDELEMADPVVTVDLGEAMYYEMTRPFIINYALGGRSRFLQVELSVLTRDVEAMDAVETHTPLIRNNLLDVFSAQNLDDLVSAEGKQKLADELTEAVQSILDVEIGRPGIETVLYRSFVIQ